VMKCGNDIREQVHRLDVLHERVIGEISSREHPE
jgi:hypothetical protein